MPAPGTLREVSRRAGVAESTASRVLRGLETKVTVTPATKDRIRRAAREIGYRPNPLARGLRGRRTGLLGAIMRDAGDPIFAVALAAIGDECRRIGWHVVLGHAQGSSRQALDLVQILETRYCEALVILGDLPDDSRLWLQLEEAALVPAVGLFQGRRRLSIPTVNVDNDRGARLVLQHLFDLGHRRIAFIGHTFGQGQTERAETYDAFLAEHGLDAPAAYRRLVPNVLDAGRAPAAELVSLAEPPTAVFAATDLLALAAISGAAAAGVRVPGDMSVAGFDDIPYATISSPPLTTVHQPLAEIVHLAIEELTRPAPSPRPRRPEPVYIEPTLSIRASTAPAPHPRRAATRRTGLVMT